MKTWNPLIDVYLREVGCNLYTIYCSHTIIKRMNSIITVEIETSKFDIEDLKKVIIWMVTSKKQCLLHSRTNSLNGRIARELLSPNTKEYVFPDYINEHDILGKNEQ